MDAGEWPISQFTHRVRRQRCRWLRLRADATTLAPQADAPTTRLPDLGSCFQHAAPHLIPNRPQQVVKWGALAGDDEDFSRHTGV